MGADNKLLIISGAILTALSFLFLSIDYIGWLFFVSDPLTLFILELLQLYLWIYLILSIAILIVGIIARNKEGYAIGGVALGVTAGTFIYNLWYIFIIMIPNLVAVPPLMTMVVLVTLFIITILIILGIVGGILKLVHAGQTGA